jgi:alginate O-acetyltransferase complex protein AlgI
VCPAELLTRFVLRDYLKVLFNSFEFIFFYLPIVFTGFYVLAKIGHGYAALWLTGASLFFYGWWNPKFLALLLGSILFNYVSGSVIGRLGAHAHLLNRARVVLALTITCNLLLLGIFKYTDFFLSSTNALAHTHIPLPHILLPLGISFFTFTQIAFLVDVYSGHVTEYNFLHYVLFVSYFPHLIAGPVLHHKQMMPQFGQARTYQIDASNIAVGMAIFAIGLAKKVLLADTFADYVGPVFDAGNLARHRPTALVAWAASLGYTFQLYFDFSGYSDMAVGLSLLFGIQLPINFYSPYKARNIIEFWRCWHITLSKFLRDYLYIPLGGNRLGNTRRYVNLMVTMLLGGLWHGANWTFVIWGGLHGLYLCVNHGWQAMRGKLNLSAQKSGRIADTLSVCVTFLCVVVAWVLFRAKSLHDGLLILKSMAGAHGKTSWSDVMATKSLGIFLMWLLVAAVIVWGAPNPYQFLTEKLGLLELPRESKERSIPKRPVLLAAFTSALLFASIVKQFGPTTVSRFLYYQF